MKRTRRTLVVLVFCVWALVVPTSRPVVSQERPADNAVAAQIEDGIEKAKTGKLLEAIEQLQKVSDTTGEELVPIDRLHYAPARLVIQGHLARLGADGVALYRKRVDGQAARRFEEAKKARDDAGLERLLTDMFAASATEDAILELAHRAFLRADFDTAEHYWRMLLPPYPDDERILRFPSPRTDSAAVRAHLMMLKLFRGQREEVQEELKLFRTKHAEAAGRLAGKTAKYVETLTFLLNNPNETTLAKLPDHPGWPTFAGSPTRLGNTRMRLPYFWPDTPTWKSPLPFLRGGRFESPPPDGTHPRSLAFHPVISDGRAYVADGARVLAVDLISGTVSGAAWPKGGEDTRIPSRQDIRHTLTESEGILYARFGPAELKGGDGANGKSFVVALGARKGKSEERDALWRLDPPAVEGVTTHFEGAPVVHNDRLYVGLWRQAVGDATAGIACYRIDDLKSAPELAWQKWVGRAGSEPNGEPRFRHALVSICGPNVVYCTDGGAVVALNTTTGKTAWEYRYVRNERATVPRYRDLCPPLCDGGRIYAAPADTDRLLCLDAFTGRLIWERDGIEVVHLLGVAKGRLITTIAGQVKGIRGFNLRTGADSGTNGWTIHDDGGEQTFGRGLVTDDVVVWPTRHGLHFLNPQDGTPLRSPIRGSIGNLCYADGVLLVTTATEIWGFHSEWKKLEERRKAIEKAPNDPKLRADLTQSLIDAGRYAEAEKEAAIAGEAKERLLWLLAERVIREGDKAEAKRIYEVLAKGDGSFAAAGAVRLAETMDETGDIRRVWAQKWGFDTSDKALMATREAWDRVWHMNATLLDSRGVPYIARRYAEEHSPVLLVMGSFFFFPRDEITARLQATQTALIRISSREWDRPSLRIYATTIEGTICGDDKVNVLGSEMASPENNRYVSALYIRGGGNTSEPPAVLFVDNQNLVSFDPLGLKVRWRLEPRSTTPIVSIRDRPGLPLANGEPEFEFSAVGMRDRRCQFMIEGRKFVSFEINYDRHTHVNSPPVHSTAKYHPNATSILDAGVWQLTNGKMIYKWWEDKHPHDYPCSAKPWPQPPFALPEVSIRQGNFRTSDQSRFLIPDDASVFLFDAKAGKELARYTVPHAASLSGDLPRFRIFDRDVLLIVRRNHGIELDRLTIDTLKRAWKREPIFVGREMDDVAYANDRFFTAAEGTLTAYDWKTGEKQWDSPLPEVPNTQWKITLSPQGLLVHPAEAIMTRTDFDAVGEFRKTGGQWNKLLQAVGKSYDVWTARELPILVIDPADGRLIQRLNFPAAGPAAGVAVTPKGVVVVTGKGSWTLK